MVLGREGLADFDEGRCLDPSRRRGRCGSAGNIRSAEAPLVSGQLRVVPEASDAREAEVSQDGGDVGVRDVEVVVLALGGWVGEDHPRDGGGMQVEELAGDDGAVGVGDEDVWQGEV